MKRINIYNDYVWEGWFDMDSAEEVSRHTVKSGAYVGGRVLYQTKSGKWVINDWNNSGKDEWRLPHNEREVAEILAHSDKPYIPAVEQTLNEYEL